MKKIAAVLVFAIAPLLCATEAPPLSQLSEMKKLHYMAGRWEGTGWMERDGRRTTFTGSETIQSKLNGLVLLVEGKFTGKAPDKEEEVVVHETLGVLSFDQRANTHRFRTYLANGISGDHEVKLIEGGWQWGFQFPAGAVRYTIKVDKPDEWSEVGEFSADGKTWKQVFEMNLRRAN